MRRIVLAIAVLILFSVFIGYASGETLCLYVEEKTNGEPGPFPPPVKEGIYNGLFEEDHIVFDTGDKTLYRVNWEEKDFKSVIRVADEGGARFVVAVKVDTERSTDKAKEVDIEIVSSVYLVNVKDGNVVEVGRFRATNEREPEKINQRKLGFEIGMKIALDVDKSIKKYLNKL